MSSESADLGATWRASSIGVSVSPKPYSSYSVVVFGAGGAFFVVVASVSSVTGLTSGITTSESSLSALSKLSTSESASSSASTSSVLINAFS